MKRSTIKAITMTLMAILCFFCLGSACFSEDSENSNLLYNSDFSGPVVDGDPDGWFTDAYIADEGYTIFSVQKGEDGSAYAEIKNLGQNDARFAQYVDVEPESLYCFSGEILADGIDEGHGANLSVEGLYAFSRELFDTHGEWETVEWYGETGPDQYSVTLFARLGGYSGMSKGRACFRNLKVEKVQEVPGDDTASLWFKISEPEADVIDDEENTKTIRPWLGIIGVLYLLAGFLMIRYLRDGAVFRKEEKKHPERLWLFIILGISAIIRIIVSARVEGYSVDVNCFTSWGRTMSAAGPAEFYQTTSFCDYPPLYLYVLGLNAKLCEWFGARAEGVRIIYRAVPNLCDLAACWILYEMVKDQKNIHPKWAALVAAFFSLNPATILNSAAWGQMDSVLCLLLMATAIFVTRKQWLAALPVYVVAVLVKPQALMLGPLGLCCFLRLFVKEPENRKRMLLACGISLAVMAVCIIPFTVKQPADWLITLYSDTLGSYPYATINTANFEYLMGGNWVKTQMAAGILPTVCLAVLGVLFGIWWRFHDRKNKYLIPEECLIGIYVLYELGCAVFGASWSLAGIGAMAFAFIIVLLLYLHSDNLALVPYFGALLFILLYVFGIKMHERYIFPALFLLLLAWGKTGDRRILYLLGLFSVTVFVNEGIVLDNSIRLGASLGHLNQDTVWLADLLAAVNTVGACMAVVLAGKLIRQELPAEIPVTSISGSKNDQRLSPFRFRPDSQLRWTWKDTVLMLGITSAFAVFSLLTLGSTKAPQTVWTSSEYDESIVFDLGDRGGNTTILYFGQVSRNDFAFEESDDGETWSDEIWAEMSEGQCWKWKYVTNSIESSDGTRTFYSSGEGNIVHFSGRYIRLTANQINLKLNEIIFRDGDGETIPAVIVSHSGGETDSSLYSDPAALLDEQDTLENLPGFFGKSATDRAEPSWWNSTYFDEIYHARTAYEFLKGTVPYETSHPPLGKVLMSWAVAIFGMTPFGWRFAGAMAGILMLPAIYLVAKQLTKKTWCGALAAALFALDCQHLTQTQIATIDSFPVLFILFSYFFMLRFIQMDLVKTPLKKLLANLAMCGLFMGLAIASKWIGIYAGMGLAVLFFFHCFRHLRLRKAMQEAASDGTLAPEDRETAERYIGTAETGNPVLQRMAVLCLWCILFFIIVPAAVYLLSYIPYMAYNKRINGFGDYLQAVWNAQISMLNYHSKPGLGMDHPFYSPWWEWPIIGKPMYYASRQYVPAGSDVQYSIFCFGNPVIWYGALFTLPWCVGRWICSLFRGSTGQDNFEKRAFPPFDTSYLFLFIGLLAQYLPWVLVPRGTYIYHYFASVPFIILSIVLFVYDLPAVMQRWQQWIAAGIILAAAAAFIIFLPYASGIASPVDWMNIGKDLLKIWY